MTSILFFTRPIFCIPRSFAFNIILHAFDLLYSTIFYIPHGQPLVFIHDVDQEKIWIDQKPSWSAIIAHIFNHYFFGSLNMSCPLNFGPGACTNSFQFGPPVHCALDHANVEQLRSKIFFMPTGPT